MERFSRRFGAYGFRAEALMPVYGLSEASLAVTFTSGEGPKRAVAEAVTYERIPDREFCSSRWGINE